MDKLLQPRLDRVPGDLASLNQWVVWKAREVIKKGPDGESVKKITKVPYNPKTGHQASTSAPRSWGSFDEACNAYLIEAYDGIGFVFSQDDDLVGIDLDDCFNDDGSLKPSAQLAVSLIDSFTEKSPSGNGLHIICRGKLPGSGHCDKVNGREMYQEGRFFTITAEVVGDLDSVNDRTDQARELYEDWWGAKAFDNYTAGDLRWDAEARVSSLDDITLADYTRNLIINGEGIEDFTNEEGQPDRSSALFFACRELVSAGANKETILTILTDGENYLAQPALERRGHDTESAQDWVWKYSLAKVFAKWDEENSLFDDVLQGTEDEGLDDIDDIGANQQPDEATESVPFEKGNFERNALLFLRDVKPLVRFNKEFFCYTGKFWKPYSDELVDRDVQIAMKGRKFSLRDIENTLKTVKRFATKDSFKPSATVVTFRNGVIDLEGWESGMVDPTLKPHDKKYKSTSSLSFDYDPTAQCPTWRAFLASISMDDDLWVRLLQQFMGYLLVYDYRFQKMMLMAGKSRSGKGVITQIIKYLVGVNAYAGASLSSLAGDYGLEQMQHAKVAVIGDAHHGLRDRINRAKEVLLNVTGNDLVPVNRKHKGEITVHIPARIVMLANEVPRFVDGHDALMNRYLVLPFNVSFAGREDVNLTKKLKAELSGIFNWALDGLLDLALTGAFVEPEASAVKKEEIRMQQNPVAWFAKRFMRKATVEGERVLASTLYDNYCAFCREIDMKPMSSVWFGRHLATEAEYAKKVRLRNGDNTRDYYYDNVSLDHEALSEFIGDDGFL